MVASAALVLVLAAPVGCGGDDGDDNDGERRPAPVAGTFVGKVPDADALVAVVAVPPPKGRDRREVAALVCDGKRLCASFSGSASGNGFVATSGDGEGEARGRLSREAARGSIELPGGEIVPYRATQATASSGLYDLTVSRAGRLRGASAAGVALKGEMTLPPPGRGRIRLADGTRLRFEVTRSTAARSPRLRAGQVRLIVLPEGEVTGVGKTRARDGGGTDFFIRSTRG